jgi:hypothetical protein
MQVDKLTNPDFPVSVSEIQPRVGARDGSKTFQERELTQFAFFDYDLSDFSIRILLTVKMLLPDLGVYQYL